MISRKLVNGSNALILFGAGASYGMGGDDPRPPLGDLLFKRLIKDCPQTWGELTKEQSAWFNNGFEEGMEMLRAESVINGITFTDFCKDMAIFFSRFKLNDKSSLYYRFIDYFKRQLIKGNMMIATFNYDCLFEHAALKVFGQNVIGYRPGDGPLRYLKIHGSFNFGTDHPRLIIKGSTNVSGGSMRGFPLHIYDINRSEESIRAENFQPIMSVYAKGKDANIGTDIVEAIRAEYARNVKEAKLVTIIGVRPYDYDAHIWKPILETDARIVMINPGDETRRWFDRNLASGKNSYYKLSFEDGFDILTGELNTIV